MCLRLMPRLLTKLLIGGNTPYRRVTVINDEETVNMIKQVSLGFLSNAKSLVLIYTELETANRELGRLGKDICSIIDAGAQQKTSR